MIMFAKIHTLFYGCVVVIMLLALLSTRAAGRSVERYFGVDEVRNSVVLLLSLFLVLFVNTLLIFLPTLANQSVNFFPVLVIITVALVLVPSLLGNSIMMKTQAVFNASSIFGKMVLSIHGLFFTGIIQLLVYLQLSGYFFEQLYVKADFGMQVVMVGAAAIYTLVGGFSAVVNTNLFIAIAVMSSIVMVSVNSFFIGNPAIFSFNHLLSTSTELFRVNSSDESNIVVAGLGIISMTGWLMWFELGTMERSSCSQTQQQSVSTMTVAGILTSVILLLLFLSSGNYTEYTAFPVFEINLLNTVIIVGLLSGVIGLLALSFQSFSMLLAVKLYPLWRQNFTEEQQVLIGRLSIVVLALVTILFLLLQEIVSTVAVVQYMNFMALFTMPIAATYAVAFITGRGISGVLLVGMLFGELYAILEFYFLNGAVARTVFNSTSAYAMGIENILITLALGLIAVRFSESSLGQKYLLRLTSNRSVTKV